ncbi:MAG: hypothetical protein A3J74_01925 [Elusimicrobia bacterium RIFCSPHIGHO2_02_FULL_57_9]|nr:MAG: hypothetical protein A3J74_01925 [Elusimicrobia bacterium RIFCSPHIGHO2_02_FULL_57_9]
MLLLRTMPLALTARFKFDPDKILRQPWAHDLAHLIVAARMRLQSRQDCPSQPPQKDPPA